MSQKREFAPVPDFVQKMAEKAPGGSAVVNPDPVTKTTDHVTTVTEARPMFRVKPSTEKMSVNVPKDLYEQLREYMKLTDIPMSEVMVEGTRRELARRKKEGI
ncbi:hypothetical protein [Paraburkholderia sp. SIMBA_054]|uniref:hypothetical protein n=1 Tax=Paraburkholderia sp. SIMBA_054 TaxID=3085795 RepID=UPI003979BF53